MFNIISLNINGMNMKNVQLQLIEHIKFKKLDVILIQEHNLRDEKLLCKELLNLCDIYINLAINQKGGTAILFNKKMNYTILSNDMSADSRIISTRIKYYNNILHFVNVYAPASATFNERDRFFQDELLFYLRNNLNNIILGGDWNCVLTERDCQSKNIHISKSLTNIIRSLRCKDAWFVKNRNIEYTYVRQNYGSRIDRIYVKNLANHIDKINVVHVNFSDHSSIEMSIRLPDVPKVGKYYWKMNILMLEDHYIKEEFRVEWGRIRNIISFFDTINDWWELYAKPQIKRFFIDKGREESRKKYGILQYLEVKLNRLYDKLNKTGVMNYSEVKEIKDRINSIKNEILEGVKIRSRLQEQIEGEKVSAYLIGKQNTLKTKKLITSIKVEDDIVENLQSGTVLKNKDGIEWYVNRFYEKLYKKEVVDERYQTWFLQFLDTKISEIERHTLEKEISETEIFNAVKSLNCKKSPGIDGIPNDFYIKYWDIIKNEVSKIVKNIVNGLFLQGSQKRAIITLIPKDGDLTTLRSWRPISLICSDVKIVAKILAMRLNPLMPNLISENQHCVNSKSIVHCNAKIRDIIYYANKNNLSGALINLDWEKAFDRVDWGFLIKIMKKLGFPECIIKWLMILYTDITSSCLINGNITKEFKIERGVRQGCPLSMLTYVLFQEPLYQAIEKTNRIVPFGIPNQVTKEIGYADDTTICIKDDEGFLESFKIISMFESASNSKINIKKTRIYGFGNWNWRTNWPIIGLKTEFEYFNALGIMFSTDYDKALHATWKKIYEKIKNGLLVLMGRYLSVYQKAIIINSLIASKLWYTSHVYPLPLQYSQLINTKIFEYIWNSKVDPIKRVILYKSKDKGGLGLLNIHNKSKSIFASTVLKMFSTSNNSSLIRYYIAEKMNKLLGIRNLNINRKLTPPYYEYALDIIKDCTKDKDFPNVSSKKIYDMYMLKSDVIPNVEIKHPRYDWLNIWKNVSFRFMNVNDRPIIFKYVHEIIPTNKRLKQIRARPDSICDNCDKEDSFMHKFYECNIIQDCLCWIRRLIVYFCGINTNLESLSHFMSFDLPKVNVKVKNTLIVVMSSYIACTWYNRHRLDLLIKILMAKIIRDQKLKMKILGPKAQRIFTENYCKSHIEFITSI